MKHIPFADSFQTTTNIMFSILKAWLSNDDLIYLNNFYSVGTKHLTKDHKFEKNNLAPLSVFSYRRDVVMFPTHLARKNVKSLKFAFFQALTIF